MIAKITKVILAGLFTFAAATDRYEAEDAIVDANSVVKTANAQASGGYYVDMKTGMLTFQVTMANAGFYSLWVNYFLTDPNGKIQNLVVNGISTGQISFPYAPAFVYMKAAGKVKLAAGVNTISITHSWGYVNLDYLEITPFVATPFKVLNSLVTPNPSENAKKMYGFLYENFQKKVVSGVMTSDVMLTDGKYTPMSVEGQTEVAWVMNASHKIPALLGVDFLHATGLNSDNEWQIGYTKGTLSLAEEIFTKGGFPAYSWHWQDPSKAVETFYVDTTRATHTTFDLNKAFTDSTTYADFNTSSAEYLAIVRDLDIIAANLKILADKGVPVLWRPLHEASGKWFWWGAKGPAATKALYHLMFDRFVNVHKLDNLIWVWTSDEAADAADWYPGDAYVDIIGRDYYFDPRARNHSSLVASFERIKEISGGTKLVTLSENGSVPFPDSLVADGAGWSYFMPWNLDFTMDGWAHDNTANDWDTLMNNSYVITLDAMPGWANYVPPAYVPVGVSKVPTAPVGYLHYDNGVLQLTQASSSMATVELFGIQGLRVAVLYQGFLSAGVHNFSMKAVESGVYFVRIRNDLGHTTKQIVVHE